jgi:hypothetical protein
VVLALLAIVLWVPPQFRLFRAGDALSVTFGVAAILFTVWLARALLSRGEPDSPAFWTRQALPVEPAGRIVGIHEACWPIARVWG